MAAPLTRWATVNGSDTLRQIALRELGDTLRWIELANLNNLRWPYITASADPAQRATGTLIWGDRILIPRGPLTTAPQSDEDLYGTDLTLTQGLLSTAAGDLALTSGAENLLAALARRVQTPTGELIAHPQYGCNAHLVLGYTLRAVAVLLAASYLRRALESDPRVSRIDRLRADADADAIRYLAVVRATRVNLPLDLNFAFPVER